ncbi:MAG: hypothetical protein AAGG48_25260 [Planctomycetota bacterium]
MNEETKSRSVAVSLFRFGLLELLLLTAVVATWLPFALTRRQIPELESQIQAMRLASTDLVISDGTELNLRVLPSIWNNISSWKYFAPPGADLELRLATEGINSVEFPTEYEAVSLPVGEHSIHLKVTQDDGGHHSEVFIDDEIVLQKHHGPAWMDSYGSSSSGDASMQSIAYPINDPLNLKLQRYSIKHPLKKYESVEIPDEYDNKGNYLWISPRSLVPDDPPQFVTQKYSQDSLGHRQGVRILRSNQMGMIGLIGLQPSLSSSFGDAMHWNHFQLGLSVRPVIDGLKDPESPEEQPRPDIPNQKGLPFSFRETITPSDSFDLGISATKVTDKVISEDGKSMRVFAHFPAFASGAKPIVEIIFDANHPERVGFLPHAAPDSKPMVACQLVTRFDARFLWRELEVTSDSSDGGDSEQKSLSTQSVAEFYPSVDFSALPQPNSEAPMFDWRSVPLSRLPSASNGVDSYRMSLLTDVPDTSKLKFPLGLGPHWQYAGIANRQVWWLPKKNVTAEFRGTDRFPTTTLPLPGGPAFGNVRITIAMPATEPVWLEIVAETDFSNGNLDQDELSQDGSGE